MSEPRDPSASGGAGTPPGVAARPSRFFAFGAACPGCGYSLAGAEPGLCPECGTVTSDLAYVGRVRALAEHERARAAGAAFRASPGSVLAAALDGTNSIIGSLFLVAVLVVVVLPILRLVDGVRDPVTAGLSIALRGAALLAALALLQVGLSWWAAARTGHRRRAGLPSDLAEGRVEEFDFEVTHAMRAGAGEGSWLLLRLQGGAVMRLTGAGQRTVGLDAASPVHGLVRLAVLPRSRLVVGVAFEGPPVVVTSREDIRPRQWRPEAAEPIATLDRVERFVRVRAGAPPPFAPVARAGQD